MAAIRKSGKSSVDNQDFDAEFEKFMNEPLSDDSHPTPTPTFRQKRNKLELSSTQDSFERALADEFSTTVTATDSLSPTKKQNDVDQFREEYIIEEDFEKENSAKAQVTLESEGDGQQRESYMTETADYSATMRTFKDDTLQDYRNFPAHSYDGMDTLEELADKEKFFSKLAADVSGTLDFAKLNRALDEIQSDHEKSDDLVTVLAAKNVPLKESAALPEILSPDKDAEMEGEIQRVVQSSYSLDKKDDNNLTNDRFDEEFRSGMGDTSSVKDFTVNVARQSEHSGISEYDSETPPSESLKSIKEVAKARMKEAMERNKEKGSDIKKEKTSRTKEPKSSASKLPRPMEESKRKSTKTNEVRKRRSSSQRSASSHSTYKDSVSSDTSAKSSSHDFKTYKSISATSDIHLQLSRDFIPKKASTDYAPASKSIRAYSSERELPARKVTDASRELQLQNELYELRTDYNRVLEENEKLEKELERVSKSQNENNMRLKYEFELEQLNKKNTTLEKQLKKTKELRRKRESDDDLDKEVSIEILQLKKELQEQEVLLNGYQLENERLFKEMKRKETERKQLQSTLVEDNQRLKNSLAESEMRQEQLEMRLVELRKEKDKLEHMKIDKNDDLDLKESNQKLLSLQAENDSLKLETVSLKEAMERGSKVIKDLERQNNEMEGIIKKRYPDSIASMFSDQNAASLLNSKKSVPLSENKSIEVNTDKGSVSNSKHVEFLEKTIRRLEKELDAKDEETARLIAASQLRYKEMSNVYEGHIDGLQKQLSKALEKQRLLGERQAKSMNESVKRSTVADYELGGSVEAQEEGIFRDVRRKSKRGDRVLEEREKIGKIMKGDDELRRSVVERASSPIFAVQDDTNLSALHKENVELTLKLDRLQMEYEELRVKNSAELAKKDAECNKIRLSASADIEEMKRLYMNEVELSKGNQSKYEHSISKLQEDNDKLERKISEYDFIAEKLKERNLEAAVDKELLQAARIKEEVLQNQVKLLQKQLNDAIESQPPPQQRINHIEMQISAMQQHQLDRENELQKIVRTTQQRFDSGMNPYGVDWSKIVEAKDAQIKQFREELDEILHTLHSLYANSSILHKEYRHFLPNTNIK